MFGPIPGLQRAVGRSCRMRERRGQQSRPAEGTRRSRSVRRVVREPTRRRGGGRIQPASGIARRGGTFSAGTNFGAAASPTKNGAIARPQFSSTSPSDRASARSLDPPSRRRIETFRSDKSSRIAAREAGSPASMTVAVPESRAVAGPSVPEPQIDQRRATGTGEEARPRSSAADAVSVTRSGCPGRPRATRAATRAGERTSRRGSSARIVPAPTRIASQAPRSASTSSRSCGPDRMSRRGEVSSRQPSTEIAQLRTVYWTIWHGPQPTGGSRVGYDRRTRAECGVYFSLWQVMRCLRGCVHGTRPRQCSSL